MAMQTPDLLAEGSAHDQPHYHFDPLASGFAKVFNMRDMADLMHFVGNFQAHANNGSASTGIWHHNLRLL